LPRLHKNPSSATDHCQFKASTGSGTHGYHYWISSSTSNDILSITASLGYDLAVACMAPQGGSVHTRLRIVEWHCLSNTTPSSYYYNTLENFYCHHISHKIEYIISLHLKNVKGNCLCTPTPSPRSTSLRDQTPKHAKPRPNRTKVPPHSSSTWTRQLASSSPHRNGAVGPSTRARAHWRRQRLGRHDAHRGRPH
jgi:hypothetical protein